RTRLKFQAGETKARTRRYAFLTAEVVGWIRQHREILRAQENDSEWLFPGELGGHVTGGAAYYQIKTLFKMVGGRDKGDEGYWPPSFRTFADSEMSKCGMDRKFISFIVGHKNKLGAESSYPDWDEAGKQFYERCEERMTWLKETQVIVKTDPKLQEQLDQLK